MRGAFWTGLWHWKWIFCFLQAVEVFLQACPSFSAFPRRRQDINGEKKFERFSKGESSGFPFPVRWWPKNYFCFIRTKKTAQKSCNESVFYLNRWLQVPPGQGIFSLDGPSEKLMLSRILSPFLKVILLWIREALSNESNDCICVC